MDYIDIARILGNPVIVKSLSTSTVKLTIVNGNLQTDSVFICQVFLILISLSTIYLDLFSTDPDGLPCKCN